MAKQHSYPQIILVSFVITLGIFFIGILINYSLDFVRIDTILGQILAHEVDAQAFLVERDFTTTIGGDTCQLLNERIVDLKKQIRKVGADLATYSSLSLFKKDDFDYLKRKYILLQLRFFTLVKTLNTNCDSMYLPVLFFYSIDDETSQRQGFILEDISKSFEDSVVVLSIDKDYKDEALVELFVRQYNITAAPTIVIGEHKKEGLVYTAELNSTVLKILQKPDPYAPVDFTYVLRSAGINQTRFTDDLAQELPGIEEPFARADAMLALLRLRNESVCPVLAEYDKVNASSPEEQALAYETIASLGCGRNRKAFLLLAAQEWKNAGFEWRAKLLEDLAYLRKPVLEVQPAVIQPKLMTRKDTGELVIGNSSVVVTASERVLSQADRVRRDWLGLQMNQSPFGDEFLTTFSERLTYNQEDLRPEIGWHEGSHMKMLVENAHITALTATGTLAAFKDGHWYGSDENGVFRFEIPLDKISYPTTRFLTKNVAMIIDTHGINMLVSQAIRMNASIVLGCCDHPGKIAAAQYLSERNITTICLPDKYAYLALGNNVSLLASPPFTKFGDSVVVGNRPLELRAYERIVVANATDLPYALWYYQTPANYIATLALEFPLSAVYVQFTDFNQTARLVSVAKEQHARVIATRVFSRDDYAAMKSWLDETPDRKAILFHSEQYPYGHLLFQEYPLQTSFGDVSVVEKYATR